MASGTASTASAAAPTADSMSASALAGDVSFLLARANALSLTAGNAALAAHGLRARSYSVLALAVGGNRPTQRDLASYLRLDPSQVVALVDDLQRRGLIEREADPTDRRTNVVVATDEGRALFSAARLDAQSAERELHRQLTPRQREMLADLLKLLAFPS